jgi:hypothetical protein
MKYSEGYNGAKKYREDYFNSITSVLNERRIIADKNRKAHFDKMKNNQEEYRHELANMLGWPLGEETGVVDVNSVLLTDEDGVEVYRMQFKLKIGIVFSGLLYKHKSNEKLPFVICQHGGGGTAELCGGLLEIGTQNYNNMVERTVKKGANVFAPQLYLWEVAKYGNNIDRTKTDNKIFSSISPKSMVGTQSKVDSKRNLRYLGLSTQHLFNKIKFSTLVIP